MDSLIYNLKKIRKDDLYHEKGRNPLFKAYQRYNNYSNHIIDLFGRIQWILRGY